MKLTNWRSYSPASTYYRSSDNFFNDRYRMLLGMDNDFSPAVNTAERKESYELEVALPGLKKDEINIAINDGNLTISSKVSSEYVNDDNDYTSREFNYHSFTRTFHLPKDIDDEHISAKYEDGVLRVTLPREMMAEENEAIRSIPIR